MSCRKASSLGVFDSRSPTAFYRTRYNLPHTCHPFAHEIMTPTPRLLTHPDTKAWFSLGHKRETCQFTDDCMDFPRKSSFAVSRAPGYRCKVVNEKRHGPRHRFLFFRDIPKSNQTQVTRSASASPPPLSPLALNRLSLCTNVEATRHTQKPLSNMSPLWTTQRKVFIFGRRLFSMSLSEAMGHLSFVFLGLGFLETELLPLRMYAAAGKTDGTRLHCGIWRHNLL